MYISAPSCASLLPRSYKIFYISIYLLMLSAYRTPIFSPRNKFLLGILCTIVLLKISFVLIQSGHTSGIAFIHAYRQ